VIRQAPAQPWRDRRAAQREPLAPHPDHRYFWPSRAVRARRSFPARRGDGPTASSSRAVPLSRTPSGRSAVPRLFWVVAHCNGTALPASSFPPLGRRHLIAAFAFLVPRSVSGEPIAYSLWAKRPTSSARSWRWRCARSCRWRPRTPGGRRLSRRQCRPGGPTPSYRSRRSRWRNPHIRRSGRRPS
jgi:hypothetical protein